MTDKDLVAALGPILSRVILTHHWYRHGGPPVHVRRPLVPGMLLSHVGGRIAYGAAQIAPGSSVTRIALFDLDSHKGEVAWSVMVATALLLMKELEARGYRAIAFRSSGGAGIHLYLLWDEPQDARSVRRMMNEVLAACGLRSGSKGGVAAGCVEVFPKQDSVPGDGFGNMFVLPLAGKSVPLDAFELDDMPRAYVAEMDWPVNIPVPVIECEQTRIVSASPPSPATPRMKVLQSALAAIPQGTPDEPDREDYIRLLFGTYHETGGSEEGREAGLSFSMRSPTFIQANFDRDWASARTQREGAVATLETIKNIARRYGWQEPMDGEFEVVEDEPEAASQPASWYGGWYFLTGCDRLAKVGETTTLSITGFNTRFACRMRARDKGKKDAAFDTVKNGPGFPLASEMVYAAGMPPVFQFGGVTYLNAYRESSTPGTATVYTPEGWTAVERIRAHIRLVANNEDGGRMLESWIALNVRYPGQLIGVALLVKGIPGDGKTILFRQLMGVLMGDENVGDIANAEMRSEFSGWSVGRALRVVEELKAPGHNRHDMLNRIKPNITNPTIAVVRKGRDGFNALNTTNYVCLTNYENALPLDETDRRWWVIFSPFESIADMAAVVGDVEAYFDELNAAIREHGAELRKYFTECPMHERVHHNMRAPETDGRKRMIRAEHDQAGGDFLDSYIESGEPGIGREIIVSAALTQCLRRDMDGEPPRTNRLTALLTSRGYHQCRSVLKWNRQTHRVYVRDARLVDATDNEIGRQRLRKMLEETAKNSEYAKTNEFEQECEECDLV